MKMKQVLLFALIFSTIAPIHADNRSNRNSRMRDLEETELTEKTTTQPCMRYDDNEYYAASGWIRVKMIGDGERDYSIAATKLLANLRQQVKQKIGGKYQAVVRDYFDQMDVDDKFSAASHIESAGEQIIDTYLNDTEEDCRQLGAMDEETGVANLYMGILVRKAELVESIVDGLQESDQVPNDVKAQVKANEKAFRESAFKVFDAKPE